MSSLRDQVALVTGSSRGIGAAIAILYAQHGAEVVVHGRDGAALSSIRKEIELDGGRAMRVSGDATSFSDIEAARLQIEGEFGPVDILVANAGGSFTPPGSLEDTSEEGRMTGQPSVIRYRKGCRRCITCRLSCDAFRLHVTQSDSGELLRQLDIQFAGKWNLRWHSPSQCRGCSDIQRHADVSKEPERMPPRNHVSVFQGAYRHLPGGHPSTGARATAIETVSRFRSHNHSCPAANPRSTRSSVSSADSPISCWKARVQSISKLRSLRPACRSVPSISRTSPTSRSS